MITLTQTAADRILAAIMETPNAIGLQLGVKTTGCSGLGYQITVIDTPGNDYDVFTDKGVDIFVSVTALPVLVGTEIDYVVEPFCSSFKFNNPNAKSECGCGESFRT